MSPYSTLFRLINCRINEKKHVCLAIDGRSCAGKSTLARLIEQEFDTAVIHMDDFFLPSERKTPERLALPGGNSDRERFEEEVIARLAAHSDFSYNAYDCHTGTMRPVQIKAKLLWVIEGAYSLHPALAGNYDIKVFMDVPPDVQQRRVLERNGEEMVRRFLEEWIPMENKYIEKFDIMNKSDIVLSDHKSVLSPAITEYLSAFQSAPLLRAHQ